MDKENIPTEITFDCVDADWAVAGLQNLWRNMLGDPETPGCIDRKFRITINMFGPGGGNPEVFVCNFSPELGTKIVDWMIAAGLGWSDQNGQIFDYAWGPDGPLRRCARCCEPAYEEGKLCWEHQTGRL